MAEAPGYFVAKIRIIFLIFSVKFNLKSVVNRRNYGESNAEKCTNLYLTFIEKKNTVSKYIP
jgi:hypothetical protein